MTEVAFMWLEPLPAVQAPQPVQDLYEKVRHAYGAVLDPVAVLAHNAEALSAYVAFEREIQKTHHLPKKLDYLVNLRVARRLACPFCIDIGLMLASKAGVGQDQIDQLNDYRGSAAFTEAERVALEYSDVMSSSEIEVDAGLQQRLRQHFSTAAIVELTTIIAWEQFRSRFNRALGIAAHGFSATAV
jgi:AhpD family alkylhydroperoxidase